MMGLGIEIHEIAAKIAGCELAHDSFPLTPALSLGEREN
jgi:hypothetical protein